MISKEGLEIIESLLLENGIKCHRWHGNLYVIPEPKCGKRVDYDIYLFIDYKVCTWTCRRPDIADPNFIEDIKDLVKNMRW